MTRIVDASGATYYKKKKKVIHKVKNKMGEIFDVDCDKDMFDIWPDNRPVECKDGENIRKFLKSFLEWVE